MVLKKEYRICMPLSVDEYRIGQLYMIARHSHEESDSGDGIEVVVNTPCEDPVHGKGQYTEKKLHLSNRLPYWIQSFLPRVFYVVEKSWNYYPYTITEYTKFHILIKTKFENNNGSSENCLGLTQEELVDRVVDYVDIAYDEVNPRKYKEQEDPTFFRSTKTGRGPLVEGWRDSSLPIMCSYKYVQVSFEVWGLQTRVEDMIQRVIRDVLLLGHRQAFAWVDEWYGMTIEDVRNYESHMQQETNEKVVKPVTEENNEEALKTENDTNVNALESPKSPVRGWFSWS